MDVTLSNKYHSFQRFPYFVSEIRNPKYLIAVCLNWETMKRRNNNEAHLYWKLMFNHNLINNGYFGY